MQYSGQLIISTTTGVYLQDVNGWGNEICLRSAGAETRKLAAPTQIGQELVIVMDVDGGDVVITSDVAVNIAGNNTLTFGDVGDFVILRSMCVAGATVWRIVENVGVALSTV
jgi:hypothetical protein